MMPRIDFDPYADWKSTQIAPWLSKFTDLEIQARIADEMLDYPSARDFRRQAKIIHRHIERLRAL